VDASTPKLSVKDVSLDYEGRGTTKRVLDGVSFDVEKSSVTCLIGPSGCGKTTLLRLVAGFLAPVQGTIAVDAMRVSGPGRDRLMVFQSPVLYPWLSVRDNALFGSFGDAEDRVDDVIREVGLSTFEKYFPYELSGGMRQRAQLARALVLQPEVLLLDEPFGALDAQTRFQMQQLLQELCLTHQPTVLMVTHDVEEALLIADQILVLGAHPGRLVARYEVNFPRPRGLETASNPEFGSARREIVDLIHRGSEDADH
jgi:NitT/TauT family transport system ATP-binding protein